MERLWASASEALLVSALIVYLLATVAFSLRLAAGRSSALRQIGVVGELAAQAGRGGGHGPASPSTAHRVRDVAGRIGVTLSALAFGLVGLALAARTLAAGRPVLGNMFEFAVVSVFTATAAFLLIGRRTGQSCELGLLAILPVTITLTLALVVLYDEPGQLVPALQSHWITIHVTAAALAVGAVTVGTTGCALQLKAQRRADPVAVAKADAIARAAYAFAFPVWTFAVTTGAVWAQSAWGRYWGWDPKEVWAFVTWVFLAAYLHSRHTAGAGRRTSAVVGIVAYGTLVFNFVGVNVWFDGLHSYAGL